MHAARSIWVDYAKAIGIILVVFGHVEAGVVGMGLPDYTPRMHHYVDSFLYTFHMPLFFFLSGLFLESSLNKNGTVSLLAGKVDTLLYPYVLWSLLQGGLEVLVTHGQTSVSEVVQLWHPRAQLWFLPILFACFVLVAPVVARPQRGWLLPLLGLFLLGWYLQKASGLPDKFPFEALAGNAVYFVCGVVFVRIRDRFMIHAAPIFIISGATFLFAQYAFHFELEWVYATPHRWAAFLLAIISVCCVVSGCILLSRHEIRWLAFIGQRSLEIFLMHYIAATVARVLLSRLLPMESAVPYLLLITLVAVAGPLLAAVLIERFRLGFMIAAPSVLRLQRRQGQATGSAGSIR